MMQCFGAPNQMHKREPEAVGTGPRFESQLSPKSKETIVKVQAGREYIYYPNLLDRVDGRTSLVPGDIVTVMNLPGCPHANMMGHAHIELNGRFAGLVHINSLHSLKDAALVAARIKEDMKKMEVR